MKSFGNISYSYRSTDCHTVCYQELLLDNCNCIDYYTIFFNIKNIEIPKLCDWSFVSNDSDCYINIFENTDLDVVCNKKCPYECDQIKLSISTSFSALFTDSQTLKVNIYFSEMSYEFSTENPAISVVALFSGLGGTFGKFVQMLKLIYQWKLLILLILGLFLGFSVLSSCEAIDLLVNIIMILLKKETVKNQADSPVQKIEQEHW